MKILSKLKEILSFIFRLADYDIHESEPEPITYTKVSVDSELPSEDGRYIAFTITPFKNKKTFEVSYTSKSKSWGCSNQIVTHWLKLHIEEDIEDLGPL